MTKNVKQVAGADDQLTEEQSAEITRLAQELAEKHGAVSCEIILEFGDADYRENNDMLYHYFGPEEDEDGGGDGDDDGGGDEAADEKVAA